MKNVRKSSVQEDPIAIVLEGLLLELRTVQFLQAPVNWFLDINKG